MRLEDKVVFVTGEASGDAIAVTVPIDGRPRRRGFAPDAHANSG
jgi:hypothetical protein